MTPNLISIQTLCEMLGEEGKPKSKQFIYNHEDDPDFPKSIWIGRNRYFIREEAEAWLAAKLAARQRPAGRYGGRPRKHPLPEQSAPYLKT